MVTRRAEKFLPAGQPTPKLSMTPTVWNISAGQLGWLPGRAPSQLLHTRSSAGHGRLGESP